MKPFLLLSSLSSALLLAACGGGSSDSSPSTPTPSKPTTHVPSQYKTLSNNFKYVQEPLTEIQKNPLYDLSYWVDENPLELSSYFYLSENAQKVFTTKRYSTSSSSSNTWQLDPSSTLLFNIEKNEWVESEGNLKMSEGPVGTEGIPSIYVTSDQGVKYYTLVEKDLSNLVLKEGINQGFGNGIPLPEVVNTAKFSNGAKAYAWVQDIIQPTYTITRTHYVFTSNYITHPIHTCSSIGSYCFSTASNLDKAIESKAWYLNTGKTASIRLQDNKTAQILVNDQANKKEGQYSVQYQLINAKQGMPKHIVFSSTDKETQNILKDYFSTGDQQLAWYEYGNEVVNGTYALPVNGLQSTQYSYNKTAVNDILTKWSPAKSPVLE